MFDPSVLWSAAGSAGMLKLAVVQMPDGTTKDVQIGFETPDELSFDQRVTVEGPQIEYQTSDLPDLRPGTVMTIGNTRYSVRRPPRRKGDGFFSEADLKELP